MYIETVPCDTCRGSGYGEHDEDCPACGGAGEVGFDEDDNPVEPELVMLAQSIERYGPLSEFAEDPMD